MDKKMIPKELKELWLDRNALINLRESYVKRPFGFKKALKCSRIAQHKETEFWMNLRDLYPETKGKVLFINIDNNEWWAQEKIEGTK